MYLLIFAFPEVQLREFFYLADESSIMQNLHSAAAAEIENFLEVKWKHFLKYVQ